MKCGSNSKYKLFAMVLVCSYKPACTGQGGCLIWQRLAKLLSVGVLVLVSKIKHPSACALTERPTLHCDEGEA